MRIIKKVFRDVSLWVKSLFYLLYWFSVQLYKSDFRNHVKKDKKGREIDIIVNGASFANQEEIVKKDGNDKCMVNFAANTPIFWELKPIYYCISDPLFFKLSDREDIKLFLKNIKNIDWDINFFIPYCEYKRYIHNSDIEKIPHVHFIPFHTAQLFYSFKFRKVAFWLFKHGQAMPILKSVSVAALMNSINSGYSYINLFGFDHDWLHNVVVDENNVVCLYDTHFYNKKGKYVPWWKNNQTETYKISELLYTQVELFESYWFIREYIDYLGNVKVVNRSQVSLIDAFDRNL